MPKKKDYTLSEYKKSVPAKGLLEPSLRVGMGKIVSKKDVMKSPTCGTFANVLPKKR
jgi:hypothetical protein